MLVHLLRSHPDVIAHGEVFTPQGIGFLAGKWPRTRADDPLWEQKLQRWRDNDLAGFLRDVVFDPQGRNCVGFKFKTDEAFDPRFAGVKELIRSDPDIAIIRLRRRDPIDTYVSHQTVLRQGAPTLVREGDPLPQVKRFRARPADVVRYVSDVETRERLADEAYAGHRQMHVWYEELAGRRTQEAIAAFLGIEPRPLSTPTTKGIQGPVLLNRDEVSRALQTAGLRTR